MPLPLLQPDNSAEFPSPAQLRVAEQACALALRSGRGVALIDSRPRLRSGLFSVASLVGVRTLAGLVSDTPPATAELDFLPLEDDVADKPAAAQTT